jgi:TPR repeat protein
MDHACPLLALAVAAALAGCPAFATAQTAVNGVQVALLNNPRIIETHPDLHYRRLAVRAYESGDKAAALNLLRKAAGYADKPSQAMLAAMYWNGDGAPADRPRGYAWMDLAADRGYRDLLAQREGYWAALDADQRKRAVAIGREIYAEYNDKAGLARLDAELRPEVNRATGSRTGFGGNNLTVRMRGGAAGPGLTPTLDNGPAVAGGTPVRGEDYYAEALWSAGEYAKLKDEVWEQARAETGTVQIGPLQKLPKPAPAAGH